MRRMGRFLVPMLLGLAAAALVGGCTAGGPTTLELTLADSGSTQTLSVGQDMVIELDANPTTGYQWAIDGTVPTQLEQSGEPRYASESDAIGAGGTELWTFTGASTGEGTLRLKYWRSFEPTVAPEATFSITLRVE